jgi:biopolymer transport protein TolQ
MSSDTLIQDTLIIKHKSLSIVDLILSADLTSKTVIAILLVMSIWSWSIVLHKYFIYRDLQKKINKFEQTFWSGQVLDQLYELIKRSVDNGFATIFVAAMAECKRKNNNDPLSEFLKNSLKDRVLQTMYLIRNREIEELEKNLGFLAVVGSVAPFVGLFGTVWGIMNSFQSIAASQNTSLAVVAPGIAEALLATAIGLLAAIPAVMFYNFLVSKVNNFNNKFDDFITELYTLLSRAIDEGKI